MFEDYIVTLGEKKDDCWFTDIETIETKYMEFTLKDGTTKKLCVDFHLRNFCRLNKKIECRYGLTDIQVPDECPLLKADIVVSINRSPGEKDG